MPIMLKRPKLVCLLLHFEYQIRPIEGQHKKNNQDRDQKSFNLHNIYSVFLPVLHLSQLFTYLYHIKLCSHHPTKF